MNAIKTRDQRIIWDSELEYYIQKNYQVAKILGFFDEKGLSLYRDQDVDGEVEQLEIAARNIWSQSLQPFLLSK